MNLLFLNKYLALSIFVSPLHMRFIHLYALLWLIRRPKVTNIRISWRRKRKSVCSGERRNLMICSSFRYWRDLKMNLFWLEGFFSWYFGCNFLRRHCPHNYWMLMEWQLCQSGHTFHFLKYQPILICIMNIVSGFWGIWYDRCWFQDLKPWHHLIFEKNTM